jgi:hypothetical protein
LCLSGSRFSGQVRVGETSVDCFSVTTHMLSHSHGYEPMDTDIHDMWLRPERFGVEILSRLTYYRDWVSLQAPQLEP